MSSNNNSAVIITAVIGANGQPLPLTGNSLGSGFTLPVKQERHDEAEIQELAAKMMETQKAALAKQQQQAAQIANRQMTGGMQTHLPNPMTGQTNILNFLSRQKIVTNGNGTIASTNGKLPATATTSGHGGACGMDIHNSGAEKKPCDEESQKGHFGWTSFGKIHIPYIFRQAEKYCGVRMIELKLLGKYLNCLHPDIYSSCTCVRSYYITEAESRLLNEINHKHCDGEFGREYFTLKDLVVRLSDATKFFQFLDICYRKLVAGNKTPSEKCGFIRINKESVVPYTVRNNEQVVPLFYFEGETENLKQKADYLSGWDLAYLKFCCKVQGIRNELFSSESVAVISLTDIKSYFPNGTEFEDYWPSKVVDSNLLVGNRGNNVSNSSINWTRQPTAPPPKIIPTPSGMSQKSLQQQQQHQQQQQQNAQSQIIKRTTGGGSNNVPGAVNASSAFAAQSAAAAAVAIQNQGAAAQRIHATNALAATQAVQALTNGWMSSGGSLPMIHAQMLATQAQQNHQNSRNQYRNPMENLMLNNRQTYTSYSNGSISMQPVNSHTQGNAPPPLVRSATGQSTNHMSSCNTVEQTIQQQCASMVSFNYGHQPQPASYQSNNHNSIPHIQQNSPPPPNPYHHNHKNSQFNILNSNAKSLSHQQQKLSSSSSSALTHIPPAPSSYPAPPHINPSCTQNVMTPPAHRPNFNDSFLSEFPNLSAWHQLNEKQKLLLTQQLKNNNNTSVCSNKNSNPNSYVNDKTFSGKFTKPGVPPLIPMTVLDKTTASRTHTAYNSSQKINPHNSSSDTLEEFERRFKMTEEMKAVVQKVLSNPDLSTFIQTNSSNTFVPFISPPISPAIGVSPSSTSVSSSSSSSSSTGLLASSHPVFHNASLTIVPSPNIQSQNPLSLHHYPASSSSSSPSYSNSIIAARQKSVICSTSAIVVPSCTTTPSPSPTRASSAASATTTTTMEVIDLSSPRRSLQAATAYIQQQQAAQHVQHQHQQAAAAAVVAQQTQQQQIQQQQQQQQRITSQQHQHQQQNGSSRSSSNSSNSNAANAASMHLQRHAAAVVAGVSDISLRVIPEIPTGNVNIQPYKVQKVFVENNMVPCINMKAYTDSDQLMTLSDFREYFFPTVPLEHCKRLIEALGVELYKGNRRQIQVLMENGRSHSENIPLVQVRDIIKYMPQLTFMIRNQEQPPTKRSRVS